MLQLPAAIFPNIPRPLLFGHRGASLHAPENTLEAFDLASRLGADILELDVHLTTDGEVVVLHDDSLERTTDGRGLVREKSYHELSCLDAGHTFRLPDGATPFRGRGLRIPLLRDVLTAFPAMAYNIEIKQRTPSVVRPLLAVLEQTPSASVLLTANDPTVMTELEMANPGSALGLSYAQAKRVVLAASLGRQIPVEYAGRALQIPPWYKGLPVLTRRLVQRATTAGIEIHVWTINDPGKARAYLARGVAGIITDDPGRLLQIVELFRRRSNSVA